MKQKAIVLLSSGLDSTANLYLAAKELDIVKVLTFNYGQKAFNNELQKSKEHCKKLNLSHEVIDIPWLSKITKTSLVSDAMDVPTGDSVSIDDLDTSLSTAQKVWVPNRNGAFINIAGAYADALKAKYIIVGFNKEEAATFPDNSKNYIDAVNKSLKYSTSNSCEVKCYTHDMVKNEIAEVINNENIDWNSIWPCYFSGKVICGECESCQRFLRAKASVK